MYYIDTIHLIGMFPLIRNDPIMKMQMKQLICGGPMDDDCCFTMH